MDYSISLVNGLQPRLLDLKLILSYFIEHRQEVVKRRTEFELRAARARAHVLEGLKVAVENIDSIIYCLCGAKTIISNGLGLMGIKAIEKM